MSIGITIHRADGTVVHVIEDNVFPAIFEGAIYTVHGSVFNAFLLYVIERIHYGEEAISLEVKELGFFDSLRIRSRWLKKRIEYAIEFGL